MMKANKKIKTLSGRLLILFAATALVLTLCPRNTRADKIDETPVSGSYVEGEVIAAIRTDGLQVQSESDDLYKVTELISLELSSLSDDANLCIVSSETLSTEELLRILSKDPNVVFAEPNYILEIDSDDFSGESSFGTREDDSFGLSDLTPLQWGNWSTEQTTCLNAMAENPSINVPNFGAEGQDGNMDKPVVVALLDTGVYYEHPDLQNVVYHFSPEQQAALGCWEWGFTATGKGLYGNVRDEASTELGHGTHTAGIIGAEWNGFGTSGVASNVRIVCIQLADEAGTESLADALVAYDFVNRFNELVPEEERIRVTSNSWSRYSSSRALDAVLRDLGERWGIVSVFSSGNDGKNNDRYEKTPSSSADNPYVIVIGNTTMTDQLNDSSEYGTATVDLAAPGTNILSTAIESRGAYFPDATQGSNLLYFGFDGNDKIPIKISQAYGIGEPAVYEEEDIVSETISEPESAVRFFGANSLKITFDPDYMVAYDDMNDMTDQYDLQFDIDLTDYPDIAERFNGGRDLMLGLAYAVDEGDACLAGYASSNAAFITVNVPNGEEETVQVTRQVACRVSDYYPASGTEWGFSYFVITSDEFYDWEYNEDLDPDVESVCPEDNKLSVRVRILLSEGCSAMYIDSVGIGIQKAPYEFATGTSMACPAVAGAAAVYASQGYEGIELASLIRSKVRIPENGALATRSGGILDFTVEGSPEGEEDVDPLAPAIRDVVIDGTAVTITGMNFGTVQGEVALARYVVGADLQPVGATVVSWADDKITLSLDEPAEGILRTELTNAGGKHDTFMRFAAKSQNIYEQDLPFDAGTNDIYNCMDGNGDWETRGPLVGLGCKLYYLPAYCGKEDEYPAYRRMRCFDLKTQTWTDLPDLPEWLQGISAVMYDGRIVVEGATMYITEENEPSGIFPEGRREERIYVYDPNTGKWSQASSEGIYRDQSIVNDSGALKLAGGYSPDPDNPDNEFYFDPAPLRSYDLTTGAGEELCSLPSGIKNPIVAAKDGTILIYSANTYCEFIRVQDGEAVLLEDAAPDFYLSEEGEQADGAGGNVMHNQYLSVLGPVSEGFVFVGPPSTEGISDTYILRDGSDKFEPYEKRSSDDRVYSQAGCTYRGRLFVIGSAWFEPETRLFRATEMDVPEYPGDIPCEEEPEPDQEVPETGDHTALEEYLVTAAVALALLLTFLGIEVRRRSSKR